MFDPSIFFENTALYKSGEPWLSYKVVIGLKNAK